MEDGEVYKRLYLLFRYAPEDEEETDLQAEFRETTKELQAELLELPEEVSLPVALRIQQSVGWLSDYERYDRKFPYAGGLLDQPAIWKIGLDCAMAARDAALKDKQREDEKQREQFGDTPLQD